MSALPISTTYDTPFDETRATESLLENDIISSRSVQKLSLLSPHQLQVVLNRFFIHEAHNNPLDSAKLISTYLPLEKIQAAAKDLFPQHQDPSTNARALLHEAHFYITKIQHNAPSAERLWYHSILNTLTQTITTLLSVLGIESLFIQHTSSSEVGIKVQRLSDLANLFYLITSALVPILGVMYGGILVTAAFGIILSISLIYPACKKKPLFIPYSENWTKKIQEGTVPAQYGKKSCLDAIAQTFTTFSEAHPLLIGRSKEEKLKIALSFTQAVIRGEYPHLKSKKEIVYIRTQELLCHNPSFGEENDSISRIERMIAPYKKNTILILDDIHLVTRQEYANSLEDLTHALRLEASESPYILALTTKAEFEQHIVTHNFEFMNLMNPILAENSDEKETLGLLHERLLQLKSPQDVDPELLSSLPKFYQKEAIEPYAALHHLQLRLQERQKPSLIAVQLKEAQGELSRLYTKKALEQGVSLLPYSLSHHAIETLEHRIDELEKIAETEEAQKKRRFHTMGQLIQAKEALYTSVLKIAHLQQEHLSNEEKESLSEFELISHFVLPSLERRLQEI